MSSNGYVRRQCSKCIFFEDIKDYGYYCRLKDELYSDPLHWVSALIYERHPDIAKKYDEKCEHFTSLNDIKNQIRKKYKLKK